MGQQLQIDAYAPVPLPLDDWDITEVMDDVIMAEFADCSEDGTHVMRKGIHIAIDMSRAVWRVATVIKIGPNCSKNVKPGDYIIFPNDKGIKSIMTDGKKKRQIIFINEERLFGKVVPKKTKKGEKNEGILK